MLLRPAKPKDFDRIQEINRRAWESAYRHIFTSEEIAALFNRVVEGRSTWQDRRDQRLTTQVAQIEGEVVGFIGLTRLQDPTQGEVTSLYVDPDYQARGVGRALWDHGLHHLCAAGCRTAWVWVLAKAAAVRFYEARGCTRVESGTYTVGSHAEPAYGYRLPLTDEDNP